MIATARADEAAFGAELGASEVVDWSAGSVADAVRAAHPGGVDALIDVVDQTDALTALATAVVKSGGRVASLLQAVDTNALAASGLTGRTSLRRRRPTSSASWRISPYRVRCASRSCDLRDRSDRRCTPGIPAGHPRQADRHDLRARRRSVGSVVGRAALALGSSAPAAMFPAGSLNHAMSGPWLFSMPRAIRDASVMPSYCSNVTPLPRRSATAPSMSSVGMFRMVKVAGSWFSFGRRGRACRHRWRSRASRGPPPRPCPGCRRRTPLPSAMSLTEKPLKVSVALEHGVVLRGPDRAGGVLVSVRAAGAQARGSGTLRHSSRQT